ncbi:hypothetical protein TWF281_004821 [Arthrobotrys megalospora]
MSKTPDHNSMDTDRAATGRKTSRNPLNRPDEWLQQLLLDKKVLKGKRYTCPSRDDCYNGILYSFRDHKALRPLLASFCGVITLTKYSLKLIFIVAYFLSLIFYSQYLTSHKKETGKSHRDVAYALLITGYVMVPGILVTSWLNMVYEIVDKVHGLGISDTWRLPKRGGSFLVDLVVGLVLSLAFWGVWMVDKRH